MKKLFALLLCLAMIASMFAACGGDDKKTDKPAATEPTGGDTTPSKDPSDVTITIGLPKSALVTDYYDNVYTKWLEEQTGYNLEFQFFAASATDYKSQMSTMVAGNIDLPDLLYAMNLGESVYERYGRDGVLVDLRPYFDDKDGKAAPWWERFEALPQEAQDNNWRRMLSNDGSGKIYAFPEIQESLIDIMDSQVWINREWLDALSLEMPNSPESLYNVLKAFKEQDPNGNGLPDEMPLVGTNGNLSGDTMSWLINMFIYCDTAAYFNVDENGKLYLPHTTDQYREALKYIRKLYSEGLMSPLTLTANSKDLTQMVCPDEGGVQLAGVVVGHITLVFTQAHEGLLSYEALPLWGNAIINEDQNSRNTFVTKSAVERGNMEYVWNLLMVMNSRESSIIQRYGEEGKDWDWAPEGSESVIGEHRAAEIRLYQDTWSTMGNNNWRNVDATILLNAEGEGNQSVPEEETEVNLHKYKLFNDMLDSYYYQRDNFNPPEEQICPLLIWSQELIDEVPYERDDCKSYISKARSDFITGAMDINSDADWDKYLAQLETLGLSKWTEYSQYIYEETVAGRWFSDLVN